MIGNVQEWVQDWAGHSYYEVAPIQDPPGPERHEAYRNIYKVVRGGYWDTGPGNTPEQTVLSLSLRRWGRWENGYPGRIGFRCAGSEVPQ